MTYGETGHLFREVMGNTSHNVFWAVEGVGWTLMSSQQPKGGFLAQKTQDSVRGQRSEVWFGKWKRRSSGFALRKKPSPASQQLTVPSLDNPVHSGGLL